MGKVNQKKLFLLWIFLFSLIGFAIHLRNEFSWDKFDFVRVFFMTALSFIPYLIIGVIIWFVMQVVAKIISPKIGLGIAPVLITWIMLLTLGVAFPYLRKSDNLSIADVPDAYKDGVGVFNRINQSRMEAGLIKIEFDEDLCAYSKKRSNDLIMHEATGMPFIDFEEEFKDEEIKNTYFKSYSAVGSSSATGGPLISDDEIAEYFLSDGLTNIPEFTHGCVASSTSGIADTHLVGRTLTIGKRN
jgi:hypothetical protein